MCSVQTADGWYSAVGRLTERAKSQCLDYHAYFPTTHTVPTDAAPRTPTCRCVTLVASFGCGPTRTCSLTAARCRMQRCLQPSQTSCSSPRLPSASTTLRRAAPRSCKAKRATRRSVAGRRVMRTLLCQGGCLGLKRPRVPLLYYCHHAMHVPNSHRKQQAPHSLRPVILGGPVRNHAGAARSRPCHVPRWRVRCPPH